jgi:hypothetical protein
MTMLFLVKRIMCEGIGKAMTTGDKLGVFTVQTMAATNAFNFLFPDH